MTAQEILKGRCILTEHGIVPTTPTDYSVFYSSLIAAIDKAIEEYGKLCFEAAKIDRSTNDLTGKYLHYEDFSATKK